MKHSRISFIERAAEAYDFGAPLRASVAAPVDAPDVTPEPTALDPSPEPVLDTPFGEPDAAPFIVPEPAPALLRGRDQAVAPGVPDGVVAIDRAALADAGFIVPGGPVTGLAEEFRLVKRQLLATIERHVSQSAEKRRAVLVCSGQPREGKSFCALNLALSLAGERESEVLLIDGDVAKHDMLALLGIESGPGLVDALADPAADPEAFVIRTDVPGLSLLPAGTRANDAPELLASDRMRAVLARLVDADPRRIILFDSAPVLMSSAAIALAPHVGQALVVVRADRTTEADLRDTFGLLSACDHVGLVLTAAGMAVNGRNFGGYYDGRGIDA
jgi:Mrp family chromosome partitioning ATPase